MAVGVASRVVEVTSSRRNRPPSVSPSGTSSESASNAVAAVSSSSSTVATTSPATYPGVVCTSRTDSWFESASATPVTVTVCAVFQLVVVKSSDSGETVAASASLLAIATVTSAFGCDASATV